MNVVLPDVGNNNALKLLSKSSTVGIPTVHASKIASFALGSILSRLHLHVATAVLS